MHVMTSITLSDDLLQAIDRLINEANDRSKIIENILRKYFADQTRDMNDLAILNRNADALNQEAEDALAYQVEL